MNIDAFSLIGRRESNQDAYGIGEVEGGILKVRSFHHNAEDDYELSTNLPKDMLALIVADGMGGLKDGERASYLTVTRFFDLLEEIYDPIDEIENILKTVLASLSKDVAENAPGSGSTIVGTLFTEGSCWMFNVGDSKGIVLKDGEYFRTKDHVYGKELESNIITAYIGMEDELVPRIEVFEDSIDKAILFSDGLTEAFKAKGESICSGNETAEQLCRESMELGSTDNITCIKYTK